MAVHRIRRREPRERINPEPTAEQRAKWAEDRLDTKARVHEIMGCTSIVRCGGLHCDEYRARYLRYHERRRQAAGVYPQRTTDGGAA